MPLTADVDVKKDITITEADLDNEKHARDLVKIVDLFARDPMGQDEPLEEEVRVDLVRELKKVPTSINFLAYLDDEVVGIVNCFVSFSTFTARKVLKIHDVAVHPEARGMGIGTKMLEAVQDKASELNCCKITLEVREDNPAKYLYEKFGFEYGEPRWWFMTKKLPVS